MINFLERAARSIFFTIGNGELPCNACEHAFTSHVKITLTDWAVKDVPCRECDCLGFRAIDQDVHGG